ncbi:MAG TPA: putative metal-binding motif-containing protein, partial [Candidatus Polarisedimenticolia bacterium]|nr:putative metal-binding motif-containing protein [Candidatus Polarisedimenticolia bacterium]
DEIVDADTDGFTNCGGDCNDSNPAVHPGATDVCNGVDDDCDNAVDEGMPDADGDGFDACADCNDAAPSVHPGAVEVCNAVDDNCSGTADEGFPDSDADGSADCADCQDFDPSIYPGAAEVCNQIDDNCNELIDEGFDQDGDGFSVCNADCNDADPSVWDMPVEVFDLTLTSVMPADPSWVDLGPFIGPGTVYDLVSGPLTTTAGLNLPSASCLQTGGPSSYQDSRPNPLPGAGFWYLARARNSCGVGTYGFSSSAVERVIPACP